LDEIEANPAARAVILTGAGGHFCAGGDVKTMRKRHTAAEGRERVELLNRAVLRLANFPLPTVAMVDGYAVGAGSNLALCCDLIVASDLARFGEVFRRARDRGVLPGARRGVGRPPGRRGRVLREAPAEIHGAVTALGAVR
jgi:enoyl-CoA hydratase/carnithine racemase